MDNRVRYQKKGFSFLSFLLGILFGIILLIGAVGGAVAFLLYSDLDTIFNTVNMPNKDEDGNYIYINTDPDSGGAKTVLDLVGVIQSYASDFNNRSLGELEDIVPAVSGLVNKIEEALNEYVEVDMEKLRASKFAELGQFLTDTVMDIKPATLMDKFGVDTNGDGVSSSLMTAIVYGAEADYVQVDGFNYPVRYEEIEVDGAVKTADGGDGVTTVKHYFYKNGENYFIVLKNTDGGYTATTDRYTPAAPKLTGHYYYENGDSNGEKIIETPVTLRIIASDDGMQEILDGIIISDLINQNGGIVEEILGGVSIGEIVSGEVDVNEKVKNLEIASIIDVDPESTIMAYLGYGLSGVSAAQGGNYQYTATCNGQTVYVTAENGKITGVYSDETLTKEISGTTVDGISNKIDNATVDMFVEIEPTDKLMMFIAYGVSGIVAAENQEYSYTGSYKVAGEDGQPDKTYGCYIKTNGSKIASVYYYDDGGQLKNVEASTLDHIGDRVNDIAVDTFLEIKPDDTLLMYIAYGVSGIVPAEPGSGAAYTGRYTVKAEGVENVIVECYIETEGDRITSVYYESMGGVRNPIPVAGINDISGRISGITDELAISELMDIDRDNAIMMYIAYGVYKNGNGELVYKVGENDERLVTVDIKDGTEKTVSSIYYLESGKKIYVPGTSVNGISGRVSSLKDDLTIGEVLGDISPEDKILYALKDSKIGNLNSAVNGLELSVFIGENNTNSILKALENTTVENLGERVGELTLQELYPEDIYVSRDRFEITEDKFSKGYLYYTKNADGSFTLAGNNGKVEAYEAGLWTYGEIKGVWKFLLTETEKDGVAYGYYNEYLCSLNDIGGLMENAATNINNATVFELFDAGIVRLEDRSELDRNLKWYTITTDPEGHIVDYKEVDEGKIGDMKLKALVDVVLKIAAGTSSSK